MTAQRQSQSAKGTASRTVELTTRCSPEWPSSRTCEPSICPASQVLVLCTSHEITSHLAPVPCLSLRIALSGPGQPSRRRDPLAFFFLGLFYQLSTLFVFIHPRARKSCYPALYRYLVCPYGVWRRRNGFFSRKCRRGSKSRCRGLQSRHISGWTFTTPQVPSQTTWRLSQPGYVIHHRAVRLCGRGPGQRAASQQSQV